MTLLQSHNTDKFEGHSGAKSALTAPQRNELHYDYLPGMREEAWYGLHIAACADDTLLLSRNRPAASISQI